MKYVYIWNLRDYPREKDDNANAKQSPDAQAREPAVYTAQIAVYGAWRVYSRGADVVAESLDANA